MKALRILQIGAEYAFKEIPSRADNKTYATFTLEDAPHCYQRNGIVSSKFRLTYQLLRQQRSSRDSCEQKAIIVNVSSIESRWKSCRAAIIILPITGENVRGKPHISPAGVYFCAATICFCNNYMLKMA
ncbi:hypothetical protein GQX74_012591 [Glossina fuscipes]|nr:hypothetical protein GQX74_012591 [Glossina fuscipes]